MFQPRCKCGQLVTFETQLLAWPGSAGYLAPMSTVTNLDVEAEARALLREKLRRLPWHAGLDPDERERRIEEDVETYWPTLTDEAVERLLDRASSTLNGS